MIFPCPQKIDCPPQGNLDYDFPLANLTSERPDHEIFVGIAWGPLDAGGSQPPLGSLWRARGCAFVCQSIISQEDADLCAQQQAALCTWGTWDPGHPPPGPGGLGGNPHQITYGNGLAQCSAGCPDGSFFTWTILPGQYFALTQALADEIANSVACQKALRFFFCLGSFNPNLCVGSAANSTATITGNNSGPFTAQVTAGSLPPGTFLAQGQRSLILQGTPTSAGTFQFTINLQDAAGNFINKSYSVTVLQITPATLPDATVGTPYNQQLTLAGAVGAVTFSAGTSTLPAGITLSSGGLLSGTPTTAQTANFTVRATDSTNQTCSSQMTLKVAVGCDASTDWINNPGTCRLRIKAYVDGQFVNNQGCPAYDAGAGVVWDGTFKNFVPIVPNTSCRYDIVGQGFGQISGFAISAASVQFFLRFAAGSWLLQVSALSGGVPQTLWTSNNHAGTNPLGTYTFFNGCGNVPASLIVEGFSP